ncbi:serine protease grass-like [Lucilia sericata]|uniref:serine protease grass-like n=1 Tax=Lucilia sericata TaxID=13632 RepID=UPI0018A80C9F|nr:serine protease grass-like [Lucilia sericata]
MLRLFGIFAILFIFIFISINSQYGTECRMPNEMKGKCVPVKSCRTTYEFFENIHKSGNSSISSIDREKLLELKCGTMKNSPLICCSESEVQLNVNGFNILKNTTCGIYIVDKISNGHVAALFGFPWMVLLKYDDEFNTFKCGGSLISDRYVLTAAHCIARSDKQLVAVRLGEYQISTERDCTNSTRKNICADPVEDVGIEEIFIHENYQRNLHHDIALLRLNRTVEFKRHIKPICLPIFDVLRTKDYSEYVISGWGATENRSSSDVLMVAIVPSVERSQCQIELRKHYLRLPLTEGQICAGGLNTVDACRGDSGGPLGYKDFYNGHPRFIQFGLVSVGLDNCGFESPPTTYTNISHYLQWITDHMLKTIRGACIARSDKQLVAVRLGEYQISTERDCTNSTRKNICADPVEDVGIEEIFIHENYQRNLHHDIALLRLNRTVEFKRHIKPICLPIFDVLRTKDYSEYVISGWGATENRSSSDVLMVAIVPSVERSQCQIELRKHYLRLPLTEGQICAGGLNTIDACRGDSGGPLGYKDFYNGHPRFIQFGLVSVGLDNCGFESPPTTYTNISHYLQWITDHMW